MIVWIAGWPRNGATLCRNIIEQCLGVPTYSLYPEPELDFLFAPTAERKTALYHFLRCWKQDKDATYKRYNDNADTIFVKTHQLPMDENPAIVVLRDGRDAIVSLSRFWKVPVRDLIVGQRCAFGTWSGYYQVWDPLNRPRTLLCRFSDMVNKPDAIAAEIASFIDHKESVRPFVNNFDWCKQECPKMFTSASAESTLGCAENQMSPSDRLLFEQCHGSMMCKLGYWPESIINTPDFVASWDKVAAEIHRIACEQDLWKDGPSRLYDNCIAWAHSELSEARECLRHGNPPDKNISDMSGAEVQLADVLGILMDMSQGYGWNIAKALLRKIKFNATRPKMHDKDF